MASYVLYMVLFAMCILYLALGRWTYKAEKKLQLRRRKGRTCVWISWKNKSGKWQSIQLKTSLTEVVNRISGIEAA